jgi:hypothetical protein
MSACGKSPKLLWADGGLAAWLAGIADVAADLPGAVLHGGDGIRTLAENVYALPWRWLFPPIG